MQPFAVQQQGQYEEKSRRNSIKTETQITAVCIDSRCDESTNPQIRTVDFDEKVFIAIWEVTQACDLAWVHCRASAQPNRHLLELSTKGGKRLIDESAEMKVPVFVLTGGDPIKRPDLFELIGHVCEKGVRVSLTPRATPLLIQEIVVRLKDAGLPSGPSALTAPARKHMTHSATFRLLCPYSQRGAVRQ